MLSKSAIHFTKNRFFITKKVIQKRSSRPQANAIVTTATRTFLSRSYHLAFLITHHAIISVISQVSLTPSLLDVSIITDIVDMKLIQEKFSNALDEIKERFEDLESSIMTTITNTLINQSQLTTNVFIKSFADMNLIEAL